MNTERARKASRFAAQLLARQAGSGWPEASMAALTPLPSAEIEALRHLRELRNQALLAVVLSECADPAPPPLDETLGRLSLLADTCCQAALDWTLRQLVERHGQPRDATGGVVPALVLGMGKLGGYELNFSSDIDLIFCHGAAGETDGGAPIDNQQFFARLAQGVGRLLSQRTEHGFVFRVDTMLRPFGSAGPASISVDAAEDYYQQHGREWERYALIKARPVAGDLAAGEALLARLRPFVYRRYLDFNAIGNLRQLKRRIADDAARRGVEDDVKLGPGGIRELEFIVQSFQLVRGGQEARLRDASLRRVLAQLGSAGHLATETVATLDAGYVWLRRLENAIQFYADQQTHRLPREADAQSALCAALRVDSFDAIRRQFAQTCARVHDQFQRLFAEPGQVRASRYRQTIEGGPGALQELRAFGPEAPALLAQLRALLESRRVRDLSETAARRLQELLPELLDCCAAGQTPVVSARRVIEVLRALAGRSTYLALLHESAAARVQLVQLCTASALIASQIAAQPALLDTLLDSRSLYAPPTREQMRTELRARLEGITPQEVEAGMDALRRYRHETSLRIAAADVTGVLPLVQVSDRLTWLAETVLEAALARARAELTAQFGEPLRRDGSPAGFGVIAYGKLGGIELGYGSDLDLVFLHDCDQPDEETRGGPRSAVALVWLTRLGQRLVHWLSTLTAAGRAYEIDLELRPSGRSGLAVVSLDAFSRYQRQEAWLWEHQALTRARWVAGSEDIGDAFERLRREVLSRPRSDPALRREIVAMRDRMRATLDRSGAGGWDVKQGRGGLIDCEFITQYLVLREAATQPQVLDWPDNWRQLQALRDAKVLATEDYARLLAAYRHFRGTLHARALQQEGALLLKDDGTTHREAVVGIWQRLLGDATATVASAPGH